MAEKFIQRANEEMDRKGTRGSFGPATSSNIRAGLRKGGKMAKKAAFAKAMKTIAKRRKKRGKKGRGGKGRK